MVQEVICGNFSAEVVGIDEATNEGVLSDIKAKFVPRILGGFIFIKVFLYDGVIDHCAQADNAGSITGKQREQCWARGNSTFRGVMSGISFSGRD